MSYTVSPVIADVYTALGNFIKTVVPDGTPIQRSMQNRVPMPALLAGYVIMQAIGRYELTVPVVEYPTVGAPVPTTSGVEQDVEIAMQIDCYGQNAEDWATMLSSLLRSPYGCDALAPNVQPLYASDIRMMSIVNAEDQYERRWSLDAHFQYNPVTTVAQQYATALDITLKDVQAFFPG